MLSCEPGPKVLKKKRGKHRRLVLFALGNFVFIFFSEFEKTPVPIASAHGQNRNNDFFCFGGKSRFTEVICVI